jgi:hypothetical protein
MKLPLAMQRCLREFRDTILGKTTFPGLAFPSKPVKNTNRAQLTHHCILSFSANRQQ